MNDDRRSGRPNRRAAELLLSGSAPPGEHAALRALLDTAAAPARPAVLAGEDAAAAAFTAAARARPAAAERPRRSVVARFLTIKAMAVTLTVAVFGGVAVAAATGNLPGQERRSEPSPSPTPARTDPAAPGRHVNPIGPPAVPTPNARSSAPMTSPGTPGRTAPPGRSASARPSPARPSATTGPPAFARRPTPGPPSGVPTGPPKNADPRAKEAQTAKKPRKGPPAWSDGTERD